MERIKSRYAKSIPRVNIGSVDGAVSWPGTTCDDETRGTTGRFKENIGSRPGVSAGDARLDGGETSLFGTCDEKFLMAKQKSQGNIIVFRNLKNATDEAITLFSNKEAIEVIIMKPYEDYTKKFNSQAVIKRLGFLLDVLEINNEIIEQLQKLKTASYVVLDTELPKTGKLISRWSIQQNVETETIKSAIYT